MLMLLMLLMRRPHVAADAAFPKDSMGPRVAADVAAPKYSMQQHVAVPRGSTRRHAALRGPALFHVVSCGSTPFDAVPRGFTLAHATRRGSTQLGAILCGFTPLEAASRGFLSFPKWRSKFLRYSEFREFSEIAGGGFLNYASFQNSTRWRRGYVFLEISEFPGFFEMAGDVSWVFRVSRISQDCG